SNVQTKIMIHSYGQIRAEGIPGIYKTAMPMDMIVAIQPRVVPPFSLNGRIILGDFLRNIMNEIATINQATTKPNPPASTNHSRAGLPSKGARVDKTPISTMALCGVLYLGWSSPNCFGSMPAFARA